MKKKGFTLVELLAVIVILSVILIIAIPQIMNTIKSTRLKSMESSAKLIATNAEKDYLSQQAVNQNYNATSIPCTDVAKLNDDYSSCTITYNSNGVATIKLKGASGTKFAGITCTGTKDEMNCIQRDNVSEYVYSFGIPRELYTYTITNEANCVNAVKRIEELHYNKSNYQLTSDAYKICTKSSLAFTASDYIDESIANGLFTYSEISSFVSKINRYGADFYTVTNKSSCLPFIKQKEMNNGASDYYAASTAYKVCNNLDTIRYTTTSDWFFTGVSSNGISSSSISSFTTKTTTDGVDLYTVTDANDCKTFVKEDLINNFNYNVSSAELSAQKICSNTNNIDEYTESTADDWFIDNERYLYNYIVTNKSECETKIKDDYINKWGYLESEANAIATSVCNGNGYDTGHIVLTTSEWFADSIGNEYNLYAFLNRENAYNQFSTRVYQGTETYTNPNDINSIVFIRWPGDTDKFNSTTDKAVCIKYKGNTNNDFNCFTFDNTIDDQLKNVFGEDKCTIFTGSNSINCSQEANEYFRCSVYDGDAPGTTKFSCAEGYHSGKHCNIDGRCGEWTS